MRPELLDPTYGNAHLARAIALSEEIYHLVEKGEDSSGAVRELALVAKRPIGKPEVLGAFGSVNPATFAKKLLVDWNSLPSDLTEAEMLELVTRIVEASGDEFQTEYWVECLRVGTGDERVSDLIFWPDEYFSHAGSAGELGPTEILATALAAGGRSRGT